MSFPVLLHLRHTACTLPTDTGSGKLPTEPDNLNDSPQPQLAHPLRRGDFQLDLVLPLREVDLWRDLAALEADGDHGVRHVRRRLVTTEREVPDHEVEPLERLQGEPENG